MALPKRHKQVRRLRSAPVSMLSFAMEIEVELIGQEIVVTKPGTTFLLAYRKCVEEPRLVLRRSRIPPTTTSIRNAFRANAYQAAVAKARELGWIV